MSFLGFHVGCSVTSERIFLARICIVGLCESGFERSKSLCQTLFAFLLTRPSTIASAAATSAAFEAKTAESSAVAAAVAATAGAAAAAAA